MIETDLITAYYERLTGADSHATRLSYNGAEVPVYTGTAPTDASAPYLIIGRPRTRGAETLDGVSRDEVRLQLRVHTAFPPGKGDHFKCYEIAQSAHDLLEAAPLQVDGKTPYVPEPDKQPIPEYDKGDSEALDLSLDYIYPSL
jgi:hypothetical protein